MTSHLGDTVVGTKEVNDQFKQPILNNSRDTSKEIKNQIKKKFVKLKKSAIGLPMQFRRVQHIGYNTQNEIEV